MNQYLTIPQQDDVRARYLNIRANVPLKDKFFVENGSYITCGVLFGCNLIFWRMGYRGFNMMRYNRGRLFTYVISTSFSIQGTMIHKLACEQELIVYYRNENMWNYGIRSLLAHQLALPLQFLMAISSTFINAQLNGMIPVRYGFLEKGRRMETLRYVLGRLKPYSRTIATTYCLTSVFMFLLGCQEYRDTQNILKYINRKTLCQKEE